ncbi:Glucosamine-phosphate N-acetyltransferase-like protein [Pseudocyphellaria aurata]|nr:Glucosamine-phosphate N-acetyltransferase-like protein [Pseudocyphellaria aurata]
MWSPPSNGVPRPSAPLFSTSLISPAVRASLPANYTIRPLQRSDYRANHLDPLRVLTKVGDISQEAWVEQYDWMAKVPDTYFLLVVCDDRGKIVGTGTLLKERKLLVPSIIRNLGNVGHIEDIAVLEDQQGKKLGLYILRALGYIAEKVGCYKQILDCSAQNEGFYVKCGFKRAGTEMAQYHEADTKSDGNTT